MIRVGNSGIEEPLRREMKSKADVVIIGGGVMGCSILFNLARRGVTDTVLVEKESLGAGSTGRSSGIVRMHYSSEVNARLAMTSLETIRDFDQIVGGDSGFVNARGHVHRTAGG